jgi:hypothetical protein
MKNYTIIALCMFLILNACYPNDQKDQYNYNVHLTKDELKSLKDYMKKYDDLNNMIYIKKNFVYSNDMEILGTIKLRLMGINNYYSGIIINYCENYYFINNEKLTKVNWMNSNEIIKNIPDNDVSLLEMNIPKYMLNLSRDEFINDYIKRIEENYFISKFIPELFGDVEKTILHNNIIFLSQVKYGFILRPYDWTGNKLEDVIIKNK